MALRIKVRSNIPARVSALRSGYEFRPVSFLSSGMLHGLILFALGLIPGYRENPTSKRPILDELVRPNDHKIVWYSYQKVVPDVHAAVRVGTFPVPRARELSKDTIIATAPKAKSTQQFIWRPIPKVEIHRDLPAPNLILRAATAIPAPVPPPPEPKKRDRPNSDGAKADQANLSPPTPHADVNRAQDNPVPPIEIPKPRKAFVPPPPSQQARLPMPVAETELPVPNASITGPPSTRMALPDGLGTAAMFKGAPPPPNAPPGPANNAGNAQTDIAIAGLHPTDKLNGPLPDGARPGQFSRAPTVGEPASGAVGTGLSVPDLTIREDHSKPADPPRVNPNRKAVLYADKLRGLPISTLSVPLRPASRTIPGAIDARFRGRNVYTMVVPIENFAPYSGDWILWFAEREGRPGETPFVRAPVPLRKFESVEPVLPGARTELRVQMAAVIKRDGKIDGVVLLKNLSPVLGQAVLQDLAAWEFKPATRDGVPVDVDVVLEIPYSLPPQIAKSAP
jgi:hypothetical protein